MVCAGDDDSYTNSIKHRYHYGNNAYDSRQHKRNIDSYWCAGIVQPSFLHYRSCFFTIGDKAPQQLAQKGNG